MLRQTPPTSVLQKLESAGVKQSELVLCTSTDIDRLGRYQPQWLAVTADRLLVVSGTEPPEVLQNLRFAEANEFRCQPVVGSGLLQVRIETMYVDLLRYSNRLADRFGKVTRKLQQRLEGQAIVITPDDLVEQKKEGPLDIKRGAVLMRIWQLMRPYRFSAVGMLSLMVIGIGLDLVSPQLTRYLVDNVLPGSRDAALAMQANPVQVSQHVRLLVFLVLILAGVQFLRQAVAMINGWLGANVGTAITFDMRNRMVSHLQQLSVGYYDKQQVGSLVGRVAYDTEALHGLIHQLTGGFLLQIFMLVGVGIIMFSMEWRLAVWALLPAPFVSAASVIFWKYVYPRYYRFWDSSSKQAGMLSGILSGIRVVKAFAQEDREVQRFKSASGNLRDARLNVDRSVVTFNPIMTMIFLFGGWVMWFAGGRRVLAGQMTLGELLAFLGYLWMFYGPLTALTQLTNWLTSFATQVHRIFEILDTPLQITEPKNPVYLKPMQGHVTFERVSFGYERHTPVLRDVSLDIQAGEMIGVVGRSGSGKTTIVNLLCRFYDVNDGRVLIDGVDVRQLATENLRKQIGVVLQEPFLFRGSIWENLIYGARQSTPEQVISAARAGNCHDFILKSPHGYDTWVGERGAGLSGGERQRVSIARVLLSDPRILILDEATSSVDAESEAAIQAALAILVRGRTTIAIAHRLSTLRHSKRILVVDNGRIVECGSHAELMEKDGLYAKLVRMQGMAAAGSVDELAAKQKLATQAASALGFAAVDANFRTVRSSAPTALAEALNGDAQDQTEVEPAFHPRWLEPANARIHLGNRGTLHVTVLNDRIYPGVFAVRCFPVQYPSRYISLRYLDAEKHEVEVGLVRDLADWPAEVQQLLRESLLKRYFVHTVSRVHEITTLAGGFLELSVDTDLGPMTFIMRYQGDRAQDYGAGGKLLLDIDENRFLIPKLAELPDRDRALFTRYIYW